MRGKTLIQTHEYEHDDVRIRPSGSRLRYILVVDTGPVSVQKMVPFCEPILVRKHTTAGPGKYSTYPVRPTYKNGPFPDPSFGPPSWAGLWTPTWVETAADFVGNLRCFRISILNIHICLSKNDVKWYRHLSFSMTCLCDSELVRLNTERYIKCVHCYMVLLWFCSLSCSCTTFLLCLCFPDWCVSSVTQFHQVDPCSATMKQIRTQQMGTHMLLRLKLIALS